MKDYASTFLYELIAAELKSQGVSVDTRRQFEGKTPSNKKAELLEKAIGTLGPASLIRIGQAARSVGSSPVFKVLEHATSPGDLLSRWMRLEVYYHGQHRVRLLNEEPNCFALQHYSMNDQPPTVGEDLVIAGLLAAILQSTGTVGLSLELGGIWAIKNDQVMDIDKPEKTDIWNIHWQKFEPKSGTANAASNLTIVPESPPYSSATIAQKIAELIQKDPGRSWRVGIVAELLNTSIRSLQRNLKLQGDSFQAILRRTRVEASANLLLESDCSITDAGFAAGYSDQAHFSRDFKLRFNMTPSQYLSLMRG